MVKKKMTIFVAVAALFCAALLLSANDSKTTEVTPANPVVEDMQNSKAVKNKTSAVLGVGIKNSIDIDMKTAESGGTCSLKNWNAQSGAALLLFSSGLTDRLQSTDNARPVDSMTTTLTSNLLVQQTKTKKGIDMKKITSIAIAPREDALLCNSQW